MNLSYQTLLERLPQKMPFRFVDEIIDLSEKNIHTQKWIDPKESFFSGHFPGEPIMPGVLILEALFQSANLWILQKDMDPNSKGLITRIDQCKFMHMVLPGDTLHMNVTYVDAVSNAFYFKGVAFVLEKKVASCQFVCMTRQGKPS